MCQGGWSPESTCWCFDGTSWHARPAVVDSWATAAVLASPTTAAPTMVTARIILCRAMPRSTTWLGSCSALMPVYISAPIRRKAAKGGRQVGSGCCRVLRIQAAVVSPVCALL